MKVIKTTLKLKRKQQVKAACVNCRKKHKGCDDNRPCTRCANSGLEDTCADSPHKRRKHHPTYYFETRPQFNDEPRVNSCTQPISSYATQTCPIYSVNDIIGGFDGVVVGRLEEPEQSVTLNTWGNEFNGQTFKPGSTYASCCSETVHNPIHAPENVVKKDAVPRCINWEQCSGNIFADQQFVPVQVKLMTPHPTHHSNLVSISNNFAPNEEQAEYSPPTVIEDDHYNPHNESVCFNLYDQSEDASEQEVLSDLDGTHTFNNDIPPGTVVSGPVEENWDESLWVDQERYDELFGDSCLSMAEYLEDFGERL